MEKDLVLGFLAGLLVGIPLGVGLWWAYTHFAGGAPSHSPKTYSNVERWKLVKDEKGRLREVVVHREASEDGAYGAGEKG